MVSLTKLRALVLALSEVDEKACYGTPGFYVRNKLFARVHQDSETLVLKVEPGEREAMLAASPKLFSITPHYQDTPWVLVSLARVTEVRLRELLLEAWRIAAPPKRVAIKQ